MSAQSPSWLCLKLETDVITGLSPIRRTIYGYSLANGTVGVYDRNVRIWSVKSKTAVTAISGIEYVVTYKKNSLSAFWVLVRDRFCVFQLLYCSGRTAVVLVNP